MTTYEDTIYEALHKAEALLTALGDGDSMTMPASLTERQRDLWVHATCLAAALRLEIKESEAAA